VLIKLILRGNSLANEQGGKVLSTMLTINSTLTELDVSDNWKGAGYGGPAKFAKELAVGLRDNGAISSLNLATNALGQDGALIICDALLGSRYAVCTSMLAECNSCVFLADLTVLFFINFQKQT
jgi:hypothetical protein